MTEAFAAAVERMELAWAILRHQRENRRMEVRYIRCLRRCDRLRMELSTLMETGNL